MSCGPVEDPCDQDRQNCAQSPGLEINATCAPEPVLTAEIGGGESGYRTLAPGEIPELHYGPQGGVHMLLGARVRGAQLDRYRQLELTFGLQSVCADCAGGFADSGIRTVLVGGDPALRTVGDVVEEPGFLLFADPLEWEYEQPHRLRLLVRDPCGRQAEAFHLMASLDGRLDLGPGPDAAPVSDGGVVDGGGLDGGRDAGAADGGGRQGGDR